MLSDKIL